MIRWGAYPMLMAVWLIIPLAWMLFYLRRRREKQLARLIHPDLLPVLAPAYQHKRMRTLSLLWLAAFLFGLIALARPQWGFHFDEVRRRGLDIIIALDTSKSMLTEDIKPNRLQQAKWGIRDLLQKLHGDRVGLVTFAGSAFLQCPLSMDYAAFLMSLDDVYAGIIPRGGTAIGKAIEKALESFEYDKSEADKVLILVTDGEDHEGDATRLLPECKKRGIRVFAIGVGTIEGDLIPVQDEQGRPGFIKDADGKVIKSSLTETPLQQLALGTGGIYIRAAPGDFGMERLYEQGINPLQRDEQESRMMKIYEERYTWFLGAAFLLLLLEAVIPLRVRPGKTKAAALCMLIAAFALYSVDSAQAGESPRSAMNEGLKQFHEARKIEQTLNGKNVQDIQTNSALRDAVLEVAALYTAAAGNFMQAAGAARTDSGFTPAEPLCNAGIAHFRMQEYDKAETAWKNALQSQNLQLQSRTYYNLGVLSTAALMTNSASSFDAMLGALDQSLSSYEKAILLAPENYDAKVNYELTLRNKEALLAAREYLRKVLAHARQLVRQGQFNEAMQIMQQFQQNPNTQQAQQLDTSSQQDSSDLTAKITDILGVDQEAKRILAEMAAQQEENRRRQEEEARIRQAEAERFKNMRQEAERIQNQENTAQPAADQPTEQNHEAQ